MERGLGCRENSVNEGMETGKHRGAWRKGELLRRIVLAKGGLGPDRDGPPRCAPRNQGHGGPVEQASMLPGHSVCLCLSPTLRGPCRGRHKCLS